MIFLFSASSIAGWFYVHVLAPDWELPFNYGARASLDALAVADRVFFMASFAFAIGFSAFVRSRSHQTVFKSDKGWELKLGGQSLARKQFLSVSVFLLVFLCLYLSYPEHGVIYRNEYLPKDSIRPLHIVGKLLLPMVLVHAHLIGLNRYLLSFYYLGFALILFGMASRFMVFLPVAYLVASFLGNRSTRPIRLLVAGAGAFFFVGLAMQLRTSQSHGVIPYLNSVGTLPSIFDLMIGAVGYATAFSYALTAFTIENMTYAASDFFISIDPRMGFMVGWYDLHSLLRNNTYAPYNALAELHYMGWSYLLFYFFFAGAVFAFLRRYHCKDRLSALVIYTSAWMFAFQVAQYNLRPATRVVYYMIFFHLCIYIFRRVRASALKPSLSAPFQRE
ncbi:MAG: hypothetical protein AAGI24_11020 [Pseudomonadota bacterium]